MKRPILLAVSVLALLLAFGSVAVRAQASVVDVSLSFDNLAELGDEHYEGWLIVDGRPVTTGKFLVSSTGALTDLDGNAMSTFRVSGIDLDLTTKFVLSIEPQGDTDTLPAAVKPLAGDLNAAKTSAALTPNLGVSLANIGGVFILATPSDDPAANENSGVWFLDRSSGSPVAGLNLPSLADSADWIYEGWAVIDGTPVTTGTFETISGADNAAPYSAAGGTPPFPGEDFLENAPLGLTFPTDLAGMTIVISIEPRVDADPGPFQFKPLARGLPGNATDHLEYSLNDQSGTLATGTATITPVAPAGIADFLVWIIVGVVAVIVIVAVILILMRRGGPPEQEPPQ